MADDKAPKPAATTRPSNTKDQAFQVVTTALIVLILGMVNYLAFRHYDRFDLTSSGMYTLSDKSKRALDDLKEDVTIYVFMSRNEPAFQDTEELLQRYKAASQHIVVQNIDPDRQPGEFQILSQRFGVEQGVNEYGEKMVDVAAVVALGDKKWHVDRDDLVGFDLGPMPGDQSFEVNIKAEQAMTGAIVQVLSGRATKVCVTQGHDEVSLDDQQERSLAAVKTALRNDNIELAPLDMLGKTEVPKDCDAVLVLGPQKAFPEAEAKVIVEYVKGGGRALIALDPVIENDIVQPTGFEGPLETLGVRLDRSLVLELDQDHLLSPSPLVFLATEFGEHRATRILRAGGRVVLTMARSLSVLTETDKVEVLVRTTPKAFAVTDLARIKQDDAEPKQMPGDIAGPVDLALAVRTGADEETKKDGRLILIGDSEFLQAQFIDAPELDNFHLLSSFIGHLTEREALIEIAPKKVKGGNVIFTQEDITALIFRVGVLIPGAAFLLGLAVWLNRRS